MSKPVKGPQGVQGAVWGGRGLCCCGIPLMGTGSNLCWHLGDLGRLQGAGWNLVLELSSCGGRKKFGVQVASYGCNGAVPCSALLSQVRKPLRSRTCLIMFSNLFACFLFWEVSKLEGYCRHVNLFEEEWVSCIDLGCLGNIIELEGFQELARISPL